MIIASAMVLGAAIVTPGSSASAATTGLEFDTRIAMGEELPQAATVVARGNDNWLATDGKTLRLFNNDGTPNTVFNSNVGNGVEEQGSILSIASDNDGWMIAGRFGTLNDEWQLGTGQINNLLRLHGDGTIDHSFIPNINGTFDGAIRKVVRDRDGWLVGGDFRQNDRIRASLIRLTNQGFVDYQTFNAPSEIGPVSNIAVNERGSRLIVHSTQGSQHMTGLRPDGNRGFTRATGGEVRAVATIGDYWLIGGAFSSLSGSGGRGLVALGENGGITGYDLNIDGWANSIIPDGNGGVFVGGNFKSFSLQSQPAHGLIQLTPQGTLHRTLDVQDGNGFDTDVRTVAYDDSADRILVGGSFRNPQQHLALITPASIELDTINTQENVIGDTVEVSLSAATRTITGDSLPVSYSATGLPQGLRLDSASGKISGTVETLGSSTVHITATSHLLSASRAFSWEVLSLVTLPVSPHTGVAGIPYYYNFVTDPNLAPRVSLIDGDLPPGLTLSATGILSGTPTRSGNYDFLLRMTPNTNLSVSMEVTPGTVNLNDSSIDADPLSIVADGISTSTITVTLVDNWGNTIADREVAIQSTGGSIGSTTNNDDGTYSAALRSGSTEGIAIVSFTVNGVAAPRSVNVRFTGETTPPVDPDGPTPPVNPDGPTPPVNPDGPTPPVNPDGPTPPSGSTPPGDSDPKHPTADAKKLAHTGANGGNQMLLLALSLAAGVTGTSLIVKTRRRH
ncbi:invasin domain 3-containing protein [Lysinibacter sp. HNR]|uniref:invasin domain 3-containing protein n=1 Tax=Lysinibacter sp. HNR TaxID=3031408 RepID=UPI0024354817|nr:invasin domain 3-containing protein [Lysinibacter sp. HNR]WGD36449.1 invasin domain 3-containing protein [Lysinibacter sp. HNR]